MILNEISEDQDQNQMKILEIIQIDLNNTSMKYSKIIEVESSYKLLLYEESISFIHLIVFFGISFIFMFMPSLQESIL